LALMRIWPGFLAVIVTVLEVDLELICLAVR
jgi:hypothetical protein